MHALADARQTVVRQLTAEIAAGVTDDERAHLGMLATLTARQVTDAEDRVVEALAVFHGIVKEPWELGANDLPMILTDAGNPPCRFEYKGKAYSVKVEDFQASLRIETS